jgi:hypothetical protein
MSDLPRILQPGTERVDSILSPAVRNHSSNSPGLACGQVLASKPFFNKICILVCHLSYSSRLSLETLIRMVQVLECLHPAYPRVSPQGSSFGLSKCLQSRFELGRFEAKPDST